MSSREPALESIPVRLRVGRPAPRCRSGRCIQTSAATPSGSPAPLEVMAHPSYGVERAALLSLAWRRGLAGYRLGSCAEL